MDPELKRHLEEIHAQERENYQLLRSVRRHQQLGLITKIVFWVVLFGGSFLLFQSLRPVLESLVTNPATALPSLFGLPSSELEVLIESFGNR